MALELNVSASTLCVPGLNTPPFNINIPSVDNFDLGSALESTYPILHIVFSYLTNAELQIVTLVKPYWKQVANEILSKRIAASWMILSKNFIDRKTTRLLNTFVNVKYSNINVALIVINSNSLMKCMCVHKPNEVKSITFAKYVSNEILPKDAKFCTLYTSYLYPMFLKTEDEDDDILTAGLLFPAIPKIRTTLFYATIDNIKTIRRQNIQKNEKIKALFLFCLSDPYKLSSFLKVFLKNQEPTEVALGGGIVTGMKLIPKNTRENFLTRKHYTCIAFLEDKCQTADFTALSVVFRSNHCFSEKLQRVKEKLALRSQMVAIRICSSGNFNELALISDFNKIFANTPLLSFDSHGEIGWNSNVLHKNTKETDAEQSKTPLPKYLHQVVTVIVFLMWGKGI